MMKTKRGFLPVDGTFPFEGLDTMTPSAQLPPGGSPNVVNMTTFRGTLEKRLGASKLGSSPSAGTTISSLAAFQNNAGVTYLIAVTSSGHFYKYNGTSWTDITPTYVVVTLTKLSGGNGWSVASGSFTAGQFVTQTTPNGDIAVGVWMTPDTSHYYIQVMTGQFDAFYPINVVATSGSGQLTLTGTDPGQLIRSTVILPKSLTAGWSITTGTFLRGYLVTQQNSGAVGVYYGADASNFYLERVGSTNFNGTDEIDVSSSGLSGTLTPVNASTPSHSTTFGYLPQTTVQVPWYAPLSGGDFLPDHTQGVDQNLGRVIVFTDGRNFPIYWDGNASTFLSLPMNTTNFCNAKAVGIFNSYLVFANILTTTDYEPRSSMWSDTGNFQEWQIGNSGVLAEMNFQGEILRLIPYNGNLIVFSRNSIGCMCYIDPNVIFGSQLYVNDINIVGPRAICQLNPFMIYVGQDNIYVWDGSRAVSTIADRVALKWRTQRDNTKTNQTVLFHDTTLNQVYFIYQCPTPTPPAVTPYQYTTLVLEIGVTSATFYDLQKSTRTRWFEHHLETQKGNTSFYAPTALAIYYPSGPSVGTLVYGDTIGAVFQRNSEVDDSYNFDGTALAIAMFWDTPDFVIPQVYQSQLARWIEFEFEASGTSINVEWSSDQGATWNDLGSTTLTSTRTRYRIPFDTTSRYIRMRLTSNAIGSAFELAWYRIWFRPGGAR